MLSNTTLQRADLFFRTYLHTTVPLHAGLVEELCRSSVPPLELATVLEDIGQRYMALANDLNLALIREGRLDSEPDPEDSTETRIDAFVTTFLAAAGSVDLNDGRSLKGRDAFDASPFTADALRSALLIACGAHDGRGQAATA